MAGDRTLDLLREGYPWATRVRAGAAAVPARVLGRRAVIVGGPAGVRRFYDERLRRRRAFPPPIKLVLFGRGAVHGLDDARHQARKAMFLDVLTRESVERLARHAEREWASATAAWKPGSRVVLFDAAVEVLAASVLPWAGIPVAPEEIPRRGRQLAAIVEGFAKPGPKYLQAVSARWQLDRWARRLVRQVRRGEIQPATGTALHAVANAREKRLRTLPDRVAAVELLNFIRPTVAAAWFIAFAGKALHAHSEWRERIAGGDEAALAAFTQEVRRLYPFTPVLAAKARCKQEVLGYALPRGGLVVLDVYGTLHDPAHWPEPESFKPERFLEMPIDPDTFVPQGGGDVATGHRCPGEPVVLAMIAAAVRELSRLAHTQSPQDLGYDLTQMPTRPASGVVLTVAPADSDVPGTALPDTGSDAARQAVDGGAVRQQA
jgi:fatty-acid peroxygenase